MVRLFTLALAGACAAIFYLAFFSCKKYDMDDMAITEGVNEDNQRTVSIMHYPGPDTVTTYNQDGSIAFCHDEVRTCFGRNQKTQLHPESDEELRNRIAWAEANVGKKYRDGVKIR